MAPWSVFLVALGVSADAFAVSLGKGLTMTRVDLRRALALAVTFGLFQAVMPVLGWLLGSAFAASIAAVDHWIAFALLALIGGKMLWEAFRGGDEGEDRGLGLRELLVLGLATSIDALAVGISFAFLDISIVAAVVTIGLTTFALAFAGVVLGHRVGRRFSAVAEVAGGVILILIGASIPLEHLGLLPF
jgi:putative Mn2+ efflux pump MntP